MRKGATLPFVVMFAINQAIMHLYPIVSRLHFEMKMGHLKIDDIDFADIMAPKKGWELDLSTVS
jgi:hypothetical protein